MHPKRKRQAKSQQDHLNINSIQKKPRPKRESAANSHKSYNKRTKKSRLFPTIRRKPFEQKQLSPSQVQQIKLEGPPIINRRHTTINHRTQDNTPQKQRPIAQTIQHNHKDNTNRMPHTGLGLQSAPAKSAEPTSTPHTRSAPPHQDILNHESATTEPK